jgi:hypothetical protein
MRAGAGSSCADSDGVAFGARNINMRDKPPAEAAN